MTDQKSMDTSPATEPADLLPDPVEEFAKQLYAAEVTRVGLHGVNEHTARAAIRAALTFFSNQGEDLSQIPLPIALGSPGTEPFKEPPFKKASPPSNEREASAHTFNPGAKIPQTPVEAVPGEAHGGHFRTPVEPVPTQPEPSQGNDFLGPVRTPVGGVVPNLVPHQTPDSH